MQACREEHFAAEADKEMTLRYPAKPAQQACPRPTDDDIAGTKTYSNVHYAVLPATAPAKECKAACCVGKPVTYAVGILERVNG